MYVLASSVRKVSLAHAQQMESHKKEIQVINFTQLIVDYIVAEADGTMAPIVVSTQDGDKRNNTILQERETLISLAFIKGAIKPFYDVSFETPQEVGDHIAYCVKAASVNSHSFCWRRGFLDFRTSRKNIWWQCVLSH